MAVTTFAAIDIGSYEVSMKIFEMSKRIGFREINDVRYQLSWAVELTLQDGWRWRLTGRAAQQCIDYIVGTEEEKKK